MELHAHDIAALDGCGKGLDVGRNGRSIRGYRCPEGMRKVHVLARVNSAEQARISNRLDRVPAHVRNFFPAVGKAGAGFGEVPQARMLRCFARSGKEPLHADADAEERNAARNRVSHCGGDSSRMQARGRGEVPYTRQDNALGFLDCGRIAARDLDLRPQVPQRLHHGGDIAGPVIDDGHALHSRPFVEGRMSPSCLSLLQAKRKARANALKMASIL